MNTHDIIIDTRNKAPNSETTHQYPSAYVAGYRARVLLGEIHNPYLLGSPFAGFWRDGFEQAVRDLASPKLRPHF